MIGTSIYVNNSNLIQYPSMTVCRQPGVATYKGGNVLEVGGVYYYKGSAGNKENDTISLHSIDHTPDLSDLLAEIRITIQESNITTFSINHTDMDIRDLFALPLT